jgi:DsbC/DsbD-like thiol-disulfide interchange protein
MGPFSPLRRAAVAATLTAALAALPASAAAAASPWSDHRVVAVRLLAGVPAADGAQRLGLHFRLAPHWHVYWKHSGDAGAPPEVTASDESGVALAAELLFPAPRRFRLPGGLEALGYEREVVYPLRVAATAQAAAPGRAAAPSRVAVDYVACAVECIPFHDELTLARSGSAAAPPPPGAEAEEDLLRAWEARLPRPVAALAGLEARLAYRLAGEPAPFLELALAGQPLAGGAPELFLEPPSGATFGTPALALDGGRATFTVPVRPDVAGALPRRLRVAWTVTGLRASAAAAVAVVGSAELAPAEARAAVTGGEGRDAGDRRALGDGEGLRALLRPLLAGALLALTPGALAAMLLLARRPAAAPPSPRFHRSSRWQAPVAALVTMSAALVILEVAARSGGNAAPLAEPGALALLALPALALALLLWLLPDAAARLPAALPVALGAASALPWLAPAGWTTVPPPAAAAALAAGFALPFAGAAGAASLARRPTAAPSPPSRPRSALPPTALGFLAAGSLVWVGYRLAAVLPSTELALVELSWLAVALATRLAAQSNAWRRLAWSLAGVALAAGGVWLAQRPGML